MSTHFALYFYYIETDDVIQIIVRISRCKNIRDRYVISFDLISNLMFMQKKISLSGPEWATRVSIFSNFDALPIDWFTLFFFKKRLNFSSSFCFEIFQHNEFTFYYWSEMYF